MTIINDEISKDFEMYLYEEEKSRSTAEKYIRDIRFFVKWLNGRNIDKAAVLEYKKLLCKKYTPTSVNSVLSSLNSLFTFLNRRDLKVKSLKMQRQVFSDKSTELTKEEYEKLLMAAKAKNNERLFYLMQTICSTGIRISELEFVTAEAVKSGKAVINCKGKLRQILLPKRLCKLLTKYIKAHKIKSGSVFITRSGKPLDRSNIWSEMKKLCETAGVSKRKVFPHNLRHLFARTYYAIQKDVVRLADILGHSNINTTRIYTMETDEIHRKQIQQLDLLLC